MKMIRSYLIRVVLVGIIWPTWVHAAKVAMAPDNIQVPLFVKLLPFCKNIAGGGDVTIYVLDRPKFAKALKAAVGRNIGKSKLSEIKAISDVPTEKPSGLMVLYVGDAKHVEKASAFCRQHNVLSISGVPDVVHKGITLTVGVQNKKPKILLNLKASKAEAIDWKPEILKLTTQIK